MNFLDLILAATPVAAQAAQPVVVATNATSFDPTPLYTLVGGLVLAQGGKMVVDLVRWFGARQIHKVDADAAKKLAEEEAAKKALLDRVGKLEDAKVSDEKADDKRWHDLEKVTDQRRNADDRKFESLTNQAQQAMTAVSSFQGALQQLATQTDTRLEKQREYYQQATKDAIEGLGVKFKQFEQDIRRDMARMMQDASRLASERDDEDDPPRSAPRRAKRRRS